MKPATVKNVMGLNELQPRIEPIWKDYDIFDAHTHIEGGIVMPYDLANEFSAENLIAYMKEYGIKHVAVSALTKDFVGDNNKVAEAIRKYPGQLLGLAHIDPSRGDSAVVEMDRCLKLGFRTLSLFTGSTSPPTGIGCCCSCWSPYVLKAVSSSSSGFPFIIPLPYSHPSHGFLWYQAQNKQHDH